MEILSQLGLDKTVVVQLGLFVVCYFFLSQFLFKPYLRILAVRKQRTSGSVEEATRLGSATDALVSDYQGKMKQFNEKANSIFSKLRDEGLAEEQRILAEARESAAKVLEQTRMTVTHELSQAREDLKAQIPHLSNKMASRILGRELA